MALVLPQIALAQRRRYNDAADAGSIFACLGGAIALPIAFIALNIALLVWVNKDAKARGMETPVIWMLLVLFTSFIGLIIYLFARPQGNTIPCANCGNKRLAASVKCPHCGIGG